MKVAFDRVKDEVNLAKHGVSLARAGELEIEAVVPDERRDYGEPRVRAFGLIDGEAYCLVFTIRENHVRAISLRRAHLKEYQRHVRQAQV